MYEHLTSQDVATAMDMLSRAVGVRENVRLDLPSAIPRQDIPMWVQKVADLLGLPVQVTVTFVSKDSSKAGFGSTALSRTDSRGRGTHGIAAQVSIPPDLPMFGTSRLRGFPIKVRVTETCGRSPATFVAVIAHELSHVLLFSLRHPKKDSEFHTDLVPLLLGFRSIVERGRTHVEQRETFGYLTDSQFTRADRWTGRRLDDARVKGDHVAELLRRLAATLQVASKEVARFRAYRAYVNRHPPENLKRGDADKLVRFNDVDYTRDWDRDIEMASKQLEDVGGEISPMAHYTEAYLKRLDRQPDRLSGLAEEVGDVLNRVASDIKTLRRCLPLLVRLKEIPIRWIRWLDGD